MIVRAPLTDRPQVPILPHPCFHPEGAGKYGRIHLPVAPVCNVQCTYCNRAYDCAHESRSGVTSTVLGPKEAADHLDDVLLRMPWVSVAGIAGPGDAFAEPARTLATLELIRRRHPTLHLCLSTNGLGIGEHIEALVELKVGFVTVTVNTVVIPGVNDDHVPAVAAKIAGLGVDLHNLIAMIPVPGTPLGKVSSPSLERMASLRRAAERYLPQMHHCIRCRADAVGLPAQNSTQLCS